MIISKTPYRISFFGGGTDYPIWLQENEGQVLSTTIDKSCYLMISDRDETFQTKHAVVWSHVEAVSSISEILHPAVREGLRMLGFDDGKGLNIHHVGDLPARAGMGSSSAFSVGLINALMSLKEEKISTHELAMKAIELEHVWLKENVGYQDQVAVSYGGFNLIKFCGQDFKVEPVNIDPKRLESLESQLLLVFIGTTRLSSDVAADMLNNMPRNREVLQRIHSLVDEGLRILSSDCPIGDFGELLNDAWNYKKQLSDTITNSRVDDIYERARAAGVIGGKLLGAGNSGFMLMFVPEDRKEAVRKSINDCQVSQVKFDTKGSQIIYEN